jgi:hypothetical protein
VTSILILLFPESYVQIIASPVSRNMEDALLELELEELVSSIISR